MSLAFSQNLPDGWEAVIAPLTEISSVQSEAPGDFTAAIFTSRSGVAFAPDGAGRTAWCVGPGTAQEASAKGYDTRVGSGTAKDLLELIRETAPKTYLYIHFRGKEVRERIVPSLQDAGFLAEERIVYEAKELPLSAEAQEALASNALNAITSFSPGGATLLAKAQTPSWTLESTTLVAISTAAAKPLEQVPFAQIAIADRPTAAGMLRAIARIDQNGLPRVQV
ncbi:MAG: uroporphyrinogen-III synthase [Pseudomonadota bacterium]